LSRALRRADHAGHDSSDRPASSPVWRDLSRLARASVRPAGRSDSGGTKARKSYRSDPFLRATRARASKKRWNRVGAVDESRRRSWSMMRRSDSTAGFASLDAGAPGRSRLPSRRGKGGALSPASSERAQGSSSSSTETRRNGGIRRVFCSAPVVAGRRRHDDCRSGARTLEAASASSRASSRSGHPRVDGAGDFRFDRSRPAWLRREVVGARSLAPRFGVETAPHNRRPFAQASRVV